MRSVSRELAARGHQVTVVTSRHDPSLPSEEDLDGFRVVRVKPRLVVMRTPITPKMRANLRSLPVDVVHAHSPPPLASHYAGTVAGERGTPYIVTYHCDVELPSALGTLAESIYRRSLGESTLRNAAQVIVTTRTYGATSRAVWRYNPVVVPNAVDHRRFRPDVDATWVRERLKIPPDVPVVLLVGRIVPHKGVEHFIEAARFVPGARFLVVGEGSLLEAMKRFANSWASPTGSVSSGACRKKTFRRSTERVTSSCSRACRGSRRSGSSPSRRWRPRNRSSSPTSPAFGR